MALLTTTRSDVIRLMLLAAMMSLSIAGSDACPRGCECTEDQTVVTCTELGSFPRGLPATTKQIQLTRSYFSEIPSGAFDNMPELREITLQYVTVGSVRRRAFHRVGSMPVEVPFKKLVISDTSITNIESEAFFELEGFEAINIVRTNISTMVPGAFSNVYNTGEFILVNVYIPVIRSSTFINFSNTKKFAVGETSVDVIETDAFSQFTDVELITFYLTTVDVLETRFMTVGIADVFHMVENKFGLWKKCAFCGVSAISIQMFSNVVTRSEGNVFRGMTGVSRIQVIGNTLPILVARFFPYDVKVLNVSRNKVTTILCEMPGDDYPSTIKYEISENEISCDCRLNWLWLKWAETRAARVLAPGFICAGPEEFKQSLQDFFLEASSMRGIDAPCDELEAVNYCEESTLDTATSIVAATTPTTASRPKAASVAIHVSTTASPEPNASTVMNPSSWVSIVVVMCLTLMAS